MHLHLEEVQHLEEPLNLDLVPVLVDSPHSEVEPHLALRLPLVTQQVAALLALPVHPVQEVLPGL